MKLYSEYFDLMHYEPDSELINAFTEYNGTYNTLPDKSEFYGRITYYSDSEKSIYTNIKLMVSDTANIKTGVLGNIYYVMASLLKQYVNVSGSWREFVQGDEMPEEGIRVLENVPTDLRDIGMSVLEI